ncbi:hypothetical protein AVEN_163464-1 [Araneus ventricosus]|uniref:Uncharacterized protein n=1 Tax=Araneus ventricosus TaxID=182803 RepID=A0A4Y2JUK7_ARAVE|nr:hypothetical protein AVEN_163464-1 [Araneus ventricosus]
MSSFFALHGKTSNKYIIFDKEGSTILHTILKYITLFRPLSERRTNLFNPAWQKSNSYPLSQFSAAVFKSFSEENLVPYKYLEPRLGAGLGCRGVAPDFPLELSQQFLSFASSMGIAMQEDDAITQHARAFASDGFMMAQ